MTNHNCESVHTKFEGYCALNGLLYLYISIIFAKVYTPKNIKHIDYSNNKIHKWFGSFIH